VKALRTNVAGVDVHKEMIVVCILTGPADQDPIAEHFETSTMTDDLMAMGRILLDKGIREVAMESTGVYWRPLYNVWTPMGIEVTVGNAHHMKNVPGRKTDYKDAQWIAHLHRMGFIKPSFIPEPIFQRLRQLSRHRTNMVGDLARVKNRVQKVLEDGNIKWSSIVSDTFGVAGVNILRAIAAGETSAKGLAALATTNIKRKEDKEKALKNYLTAEHCRVIKSLMNQYDFLTSEIRGIENDLAEQMVPYADLIEKLDAIPGIDKVLAMAILTEATTRMQSFPDERKFAAWAGVAPGNNESAGKKKDQNAEKAILI
jgi:transposase